MNHQNQFWNHQLIAAFIKGHPPEQMRRFERTKSSNSVIIITSAI
jgi:hypothetical protein